MGLPVTIAGFTRLTIAVERVADALETIADGATSGDVEIPDEIADALISAKDGLKSSTDALGGAVASNQP
jgi:hypothetical protein